MIGSIAGDIIGSRFETQTLIDRPESLWARECSFTDDTICVIAVAQSLLTGSNLHASFQKWVRRYPSCEYGGKLRHWALSASPLAYGSYGNGGAMRVSPVALLASSMDEANQISKSVTEVTHNHEYALRAAIVLTQCIYLALSGQSKNEIRQHVIQSGLVILDVQTYRAKRLFSTDAVTTIGPAIASVLSAECFESAMYNCIEIGGDTDTICCMAGGLAEAIFGIGKSTCDQAMQCLDNEMKQVVTDLYKTAGYEQIGIPLRPQPNKPMPAQPGWMSRFWNLLKT